MGKSSLEGLYKNLIESNESKYFNAKFRFILALVFKRDFAQNHIKKLF